jgi:hypothetical protein
VVSDYLKTYRNYYNVVNGQQQPLSEETLAVIANSNIVKTLQVAFGVEDLKTADLAAKAEAYISGAGLTAEEIANLKANLAGTVSGDEPVVEAIGKALGDYPTANAFTQPNAFVDLMNTVQIWGAYDRTGTNTPDNAADDTPAMLSIVSPLRFSEENYISAGDIYMDDINALYSEADQRWVYQVEMTGKQVYLWLEFAASKLKRNSSGNPYVPTLQMENYDIIMGDGFHYEIDLSKAAGERVVALTYNGEPIISNQKFTVAMNTDRFNSTSPYVMYINEKSFNEFDPDDHLIYSTEVNMTNGQTEGTLHSLLISYIKDQTARNGGITPVVKSDWSITMGAN